MINDRLTYRLVFKPASQASMKSVFTIFSWHIFIDPCYMSMINMFSFFEKIFLGSQIISAIFDNICVTSGVVFSIDNKGYTKFPMK